MPRERLAVFLKGPIFALLVVVVFSMTAAVWFGLAWVGFHAAKGLGW